MGMQRRPSEELPKKNKDLEHPERFHEVHDLFLFSAPPFTAPCKHAIQFFPRSICSPTRSTHATLCSAVLFGICGLTTFVHACECAALFTGCRGSWKSMKKTMRFKVFM
jgi:hypothetical protein